VSVFSQAIYTQTVGATSTNVVTFNNIPQGFTDLRLEIDARLDNAADQLIYFYVNGDQRNAYSTTWLFGNGSVASSARTTGQGQAQGGAANGASTTASTFSSTEIYIPMYTSGLYKQANTFGVSEANASSNYMAIGGSNIPITSPITSLTIFYGAIQFTQGTTFTLHGVSGVYDTAIPVAPTVGAATDQAGFVSLEFVPAANDGADSYVVTSSPAGSTTYGSSSPIKTPTTLGTAYSYKVSSVNSLGTGHSAQSNSVTSDNSYASIATVSLTSGAASSMLFANIPQHYKHLQIRFYGFAPSANTNYFTTINGSGFGNYARHHILGNGSAASTGGVANDAPIFYFTGGTTSSSSPFVSVIDILDYTDTSKYTTARCLSGRDCNGSGEVGLYSWFWNSFAPVTSISLDSFSTNQYAQYSHAALYGIA